MDFRNWYRSKYPFISSEDEFSRLQEAWKTAAEAEREACAKICDNRAKQYSEKADETDDEKYHVYLKARAWECSVLACDIRKLAPNAQVNPAGVASPVSAANEG